MSERKNRWIRGKRHDIFLAVGEVPGYIWKLRISINTFLLSITEEIKRGKKKMKLKEKIEVGILVLSILTVLGAGMNVAAASIDITNVSICEERVGVVEYENIGDKRSKGLLTVSIDNIMILETEIRTYAYKIGDEVLTPARFKYFDLNETEGMHRIEVVLIVGVQMSIHVLHYEGLGLEEVTELVEEEVKSEEIVEDWLECP